MEADINDLLRAWQQHTDSVLNILDGFDRSKDLVKPSENAWSFLDVLEHLFISEKGASRLLAGDYADKEVDLKETAEMMDRGFVANERKFKAPGELGPKGRFIEYSNWRQAWLDNRELMAKLVLEKGLHGYVDAWEHPIFGYMTRGQWLVFSQKHFDRHMVQIQNLR